MNIRFRFRLLEGPILVKLGSTALFRKVKLCYDPLSLGTVIVLVSSGSICKYSILYSQFGPKCMDFTRNTPQLN